MAKTLTRQQRKFKNCAVTAQEKAKKEILENPRQNMLKAYGRNMGKCLRSRK